MERDYWAGVLPGCPRHNLTIGGVTFADYVELVTPDPAGLKDNRQRLFGSIARLDEDQVEAIKVLARRKLVRGANRRTDEHGVALPTTTIVKDDRFDVELWNRTRKPAQVVASQPKYRSQRGDEPVGKYLFLIPVEDAPRLAGPAWRSTGPTKDMPALLAGDELRMPDDREIWAEVWRHLADAHGEDYANARFGLSGAKAFAEAQNPAVEIELRKNPPKRVRAPALA